MTIHRNFLDASAAAALMATGLPALAAAWPSHPLRIVVPFPPGVTSDVIARLISKPLTLGQRAAARRQPGRRNTATRASACR